MTRRKKQENKKEEKTEEKTVDRFAEAREKRRKAWEAKQSQAKSSEEKDREAFRKYFIKIKGKLGLDKSMEEVIWKHFKATGHNKKEKFEDGIKHFGYKL